jgi:hypothetical protein
LVFEALDTNKNGKLEKIELMEDFKKLELFEK